MDCVRVACCTLELRIFPGVLLTAAAPGSQRLPCSQKGPALDVQ